MGEKSTENFFIEIIQETFARSGLKLNIKKGPWIRNQKKVIEAAPNKGLVITPLTRTKDRESSYDWILPISKYKLTFITNDQSIDITNINTLKNIPVCAFRESPAEYKLRDLDFTKIRTKVQEQKCFQSLKLETGKVMLAHGKIAAIKGYKLVGGNPDKLIFGKSFSEKILYLASTKNAIPGIDKKKLKDAFESIKADGTYHKKYAILSAKYHWDEDFYIFIESKLDNSTLSKQSTDLAEDATGIGMMFEF